MSSLIFSSFALFTCFVCAGCGSRFQAANSSSAASNSQTAGGNNTVSTTPNPVVQLSWTGHPGEQQGFYIEQSTDGKNFTQIQTVADGTYTTDVTGLTPGATYYFRIRGYNQAGESGYSSIVSLTVNP